MCRPPIGVIMPADWSLRRGLGRVLRRMTATADSFHAEDLQADLAETGAIPVTDCNDRANVCVAGTLRTVTLWPRGSSGGLVADLWDGTASVRLIWLGRREIPGIRPGRNVVARGRLTIIEGERTIYNPRYELRPTEQS